MSTILLFKMPEKAGPRRATTAAKPDGEVVIFPGVRIERHDLDLGYRLRDCAGHSDFDGIGNPPWPRKTS